MWQLDHLFFSGDGDIEHQASASGG